MNNFTLTSGSLSARDGGPLRLTKSEYNKLTQSGNLSRPTTENKMISSEGYRSGGDSDRAHANPQGVKTLDFNKQKTIHRISDRKNQTGSSTINEVNYDKLDLLMRGMEDDNSTMNL